MLNILTYLQNIPQSGPARAPKQDEDGSALNLNPLIDHNIGRSMPTLSDHIT